MLTWAGNNIVLGYTPTGEIVLFLVSYGPRGELRYAPLAKTLPVSRALPAAA